MKAPRALFGQRSELKMMDMTETNTTVIRRDV
jgi:hypothetical protein